MKKPLTSNCAVFTRLTVLLIDAGEPEQYDLLFHPTPISLKRTAKTFRRCSVTLRAL